MQKTVGILGTGSVGQTLAKGFAGQGYEVAIGSRAGDKVKGWDGAIGTFAEVAANAELIVLAVKGLAAEEVVGSLVDELGGKTVIDTTNPIADTPPQDGVLSFFTSLDDSLMERLQKLAPDAHFVKAFNSIGSENMVQPSFAEGKPTMYICGNDDAAKKEVSGILKAFGLDSVDMGKATSARAIEPLCILWCIPGMLRGQWTHAFKLLTK